MVTDGNNSDGRRYGVDEKRSQGDPEPVRETGFMTSSVKREEASKVLVQVDVGGESNGIEENC